MANLDDLLVKTSRTFALTIPLLPEPTRREVTVAYLLFRIADTFEDASHWPRERRIEALRRFAELLECDHLAAVAGDGSDWGAEQASAHQGYVELLSEMPTVLEAFAALAEPARRRIRLDTARTARGMARFVARTGDDGRLELEDVPDLKGYCYVVAGIVGEMLTELFVLGHRSLQPTAPYLRERAPLFGEALQLVNILKDSADDAREGRSYLPARVDRAEVFDLARRDLEASAEYVHALQRAAAPRGLVEFTALPVLLARATLDRVEGSGPGAKLSRPEVASIVDAMRRALDQERPAIPA
ncbi:MAG TPA: squalene/phytoene synthase family protein [Thermoanaerobaculia bacterium]|nr:squalene/phytoene synthase family protein [Thermoanaerobaculia bacterium]